MPGLPDPKSSAMADMFLSLMRMPRTPSRPAVPSQATPQPVFRPDGASGPGGALMFPEAIGARGQTPSVYRPMTTPRRGR